jgi:DNA-binding protein
MAEGQRVLNQVLQDSEKKEEEKQEKSEEKQEEEKQEKSEPEVQSEETEEETGKQEEQESAEGAKEEAPKQEPAKAEERKPEPRKQPERRPRKGAAPNVVFVGKKPTMSYVLAVVTQFSDGMDDVHIKARGRSISRAVDVAEVVRNRFVQGVNTDVQIGTDEIIDENNNKINVSTIDIKLNK